MEDRIELVDRHLQMIQLQGELKGIDAAMGVVWAAVQRQDASSSSTLWRDLWALHDRKCGEMNAVNEGIFEQMRINQEAMSRAHAAIDAAHKVSRAIRAAQDLP